MFGVIVVNQKTLGFAMAAIHSAKMGKRLLRFLKQGTTSYAAAVFLKKLRTATVLTAKVTSS